VEGQTGAPRVVLTAGVDDQHVGSVRELADDLHQQPSFAQRQQPGRVRRVKPIAQDRALYDGPALEDHRRRPGRIACRAESLPASR
jgi:hypothetical protein